MPNFQTIQALLQQASTRGARSTVLHPLQWLVFLLVTGVVSNGVMQGPAWLTVTLCALGGIAVGFFLVMYVLIWKKDPEALRSERFHIERLAIQKAVFGDNVAGEFVDSLEPKASSHAQLPAADSDEVA